MGHELVLTDTALVRRAVELKQAALIYDAIVILRTEEFSLGGQARAQRLPNELDWLLDQGIVRVEEAPPREKDLDVVDDYTRYLDESRAAFINFLLLGDGAGENFLRCAAGGLARAYAARAEHLGASAVTPVAFGPEFELRSLLGRAPRETPAAAAQTFALVMGSLPLLDGEVAWEDIVAFRSDKRARAAVLDFRQWLRRAEGATRSEAEFAEMLSEETRRYEEALRSHRIAYRYGMLKVLVTAPAAIVEKLLALSVSGALKELFAVSDLYFQMMKSESELAAREVRVIQLAKEAFTST